ncbi:hypothetical protein BJX61DRAFT_540351 [Aspergillus egyptiacus]|nr:hypothetical protein BJX61DRAFT_540351 [Aspergillus egyptiacus]
MSANDYYNQGPPGGHPQVDTTKVILSSRRRATIPRKVQVVTGNSLTHKDHTHIRHRVDRRHRCNTSNNLLRRRKIAGVSLLVWRPSAAASFARKPANVAWSALNAARCVNVIDTTPTRR